MLEKRTALQKLDDLVGMQEVKEKINAIVAMAEQETPDANDRSLHFIITGNPGTGKTTVAELIGEILYETGYLKRGHTIKVTRDELVAGYVGQTAIKTKERINEAIGGVLFIDEAYTLARRGEDPFGQEAIDTILEAMSDKNGLFSVIVAGYPNEMKAFINSNPGLSRRFGGENKKIHIDDYSAEELADIFYLNLHSNSQNRKYKLSDDLSNIIIDFFENWLREKGEKWGNAREVENLFEQMDGSWSKRKGEKSPNDELILEKCDIPANLQKHCRPSDEAGKDTLEELNQLTGLKRVKEKIEDIKRLIKFGGAHEPGHYIFEGSPGTGKTTVARLFGKILREVGVLKRGHVIEVNREDLVSEYTSDTAQKTKKQLEKALDGVLFIDEAYRLYEIGGYNHGKEAIETILAFMENNRERLCVICAGYKDDMDKFVNSNDGLQSRFTERIYFDDFDKDELIEILRSFDKDFVFELEYLEKSRTIFDFFIKSKDRKFGNARSVRKYFSESKATLYKRLEDIYIDASNVPENEKKTLTGDDIPSDYLSIINN